MERRGTRPVLKPVSETMRGWAEALRSEVEEWPAVRVTRGFGMILVYRGDTVFAALPGSRMLSTEDAILLKFQEDEPKLARRIAADLRFAASTLASTRKPKSEGRKWRFFLLRADSDVHAAIEWLAEAYQSAHKTKRQAAAERKAGDKPRPRSGR